MLTEPTVRTIVDTYGVPVYIYDSNSIIDKIKKTKDSFPAYNILYSVKANPFPDILQVMHQNGVGIDAASCNEVLAACDAGHSPQSIYYSAPGKTPAHIEAAWGKCNIIADSISEIGLINGIAKTRGEKVSLGVRLNISNEAVTNSKYEVMGGRASQFGIDMPTFLEWLNEVERYENINISGIHVYFGSQMMDERVIAKNFEVIAEAYLQLKKIVGIQYVNIGGGFGIPYEEGDNTLDLGKIAALTGNCAAVKEMLSQEGTFNIELGRYLVAECGIYVTKVLDVKESFGKKYVILQGGMNAFFRPVFTKQTHAITTFSESAEREDVCVVGNLCTPLDTYYTNITAYKLSIGDLVMFQNAGAYGYSMSMLEFISHEKPAQLLWGGQGS